MGTISLTVRMTRVVTRKLFGEVWSAAFSHVKTVHCYGKGPSFRVPTSDEAADPNAMFVCVNHTVNEVVPVVGRCDLFVAMDCNVYEAIPSEIMSKVGAILIPYRPHVTREPTTMTYEPVIAKLDSFKGDVYVMNLFTSQRVRTFVDCEGGKTSLSIGVGFILKHMHNAEKVHVYGCGGIGYHPNFSNSLILDKRHTDITGPADIYDRTLSKRMRRHMAQVIDQHKAADKVVMH